MKTPLLCAVSLLCFGGGWWVDGWISNPVESKSVSRFLNPEPSSKQPAGPLPAVPPAQALDPVESRSSSSIHSLDDLLKLEVAHRPNQTQARLADALAHLNATELASLAREFKERQTHAPRNAWPSSSVAMAISNRWLQLDPAAAATFILQSGFPGASGEFAGPFYDAIKKLVRTELPMVRRLMAGTNDRDLYIMTRLEYVDSLEGTDPSVALPLIVDFELKTRNETFFATNYKDFPRDWVRNDPSSAINWALALPSGHIRETLAHSMAKAWAETDASAARKFFEERLPDGVPYNLRPMLKELVDHISPPAENGKSQGQ